MIGRISRKLTNRQSQSSRPRRSLAFRCRVYRPCLEPLEKRELLDGNAGGIAYGQIPLSFEANQGQTDPAVQFLSRGSGYALFLTSQEAVLGLSKPVAPKAGNTTERAPSVEDVLRMELVGANARARVVGEEELPGTVNYFLGNDPARWRTTVPTYGKVAYRDVYPGIDLVYYGNQRQLEYDFVLGPGADPRVIGLSFQGAQNLTLDAHGNLVLHTAGGDVVEHAPVVYQDGAEGQQAVAGRYVMLGQDRVGFQVDSYDASRRLVIDPVLSYSTYLGGSGNDLGSSIAVNASGNAFVTGRAASSNFPTTPGSVQRTYDGNYDAFVAKLNSTGTALIYSTYLGGSGFDSGLGIAVDASDNVYVTGNTESRDFPTTPGALQTTFRGLNDQAFVAKLDATGTTLLYSTFLGGRSDAGGTGIAVDASGNAYVTGDAGSNFPTTPGALQTTFGAGPNPEAFVAKLNATGTALLYSTYLGGSSFASGSGIAVDGFGNAYVTGYAGLNFPTTPGALQTTSSGNFDAFVAKLNTTGTALLYSTYLGGSGDDYGFAIAVDASGNAFVTGSTTSSNFSTTRGAVQTTIGGNTDAFVAKLNAAGTALLYSTYLGGSGDDLGSGIALDALGNAFVIGSTTSSNFPTTPGAVQTTYGGGAFDAFVAKTVSQASVTTVSSSINPSVYGQPVTFTATVTGGGSPVSTGTIT